MSGLDSDYEYVDDKADNFQDTTSNVMGYIDNLTGLVTAGILPKEKLPVLIAAMVSGGGTEKKVSKKKNAVTNAMVNARKYRSPARPETVKVRQILNPSIKRRFGLQCATVDSVLWKKTASLTG